ncbi:hypothetical protein JTB14_017212 [Gonioctena quinquepunctata]|nr:hypothetical protein JTB14_017212 [Gonioctena quinquepunctata]
MVKVKLYGKNTVLETVALCDEASSVTLVDKSIANRLELDGTPQPLCIQWTNNLSSRHEDSSCLKFKISGVFSGAKIFSMKNVRTVKNVALPVQEIRRSDWERYSHLEGIPFHEISERPMILLGQDNIHLTVARKVIQSTKNEPIATKTNLGWILHGGNWIEQEKQAYFFHICSSEISDISLHEMVKQSFTTDAFGVVPKKTNINKAEALAIDIIKSSVRRVGERFELGLLWKEDNIHLPEKTENGAKSKVMEDISNIINLGIRLADLDLTTKDLEKIRNTIYRSRSTFLLLLRRSRMMSITHSTVINVRPTRVKTFH